MLLGMNWEWRLREMVLAGGALAATACSPSGNAAVNTCDDPCCGIFGQNASMTPACEQWMECVDRGGGSITASDYDQSCSVDSDCVGVTQGNLCAVGCNYVNAAISLADERKYQSDVSSKMGDRPACPGPPFPAACNAGTCGLATGFPLPSADAEADAAADANPDAATDAAAADASAE